MALLPHLDQVPLYNSINFNVTGVAVPIQNATAVRIGVIVFLCPSDQPPVHPTTGRISYAGNRGVGVQRSGYNGAFAIYEPIALASFTDGLSTTAAMTEWLSGGQTDGPGRDSRRNVFRTPRELVKPAQFDEFAAACRALDPQTALPGAPQVKGTNWSFGEFGFCLYNHTLEPNQHSCTNGTALQQGAWTAGSGHAGGVNLLFADGHERVIRDTVRIEAWRALGSRNGAEALSDDAY